MPSPVGHFIGGVAAGSAFGGSGGRRPRAPSHWWQAVDWREIVLFGGLGVLPDFDLLFGVHREASHSLGAALAIGVVAWLIARVLRSTAHGAHLQAPVTFAIACGAAYGSHVLLDWLATDTSAPFGVMALWPLNDRYYESDLHLFMPISRRYHQGWSFMRHNLIALAWELVILVPVLAVVLIARKRRES